MRAGGGERERLRRRRCKAREGLGVAVELVGAKGDAEAPFIREMRRWGGGGAGGRAQRPLMVFKVSRSSMVRNSSGQGEITAQAGARARGRHREVASAALVLGDARRGGCTWSSGLASVGGPGSGGGRR